MYVILHFLGSIMHVSLDFNSCILHIALNSLEHNMQVFLSFDYKDLKKDMHF